ncbi:hypothetical protein AOG2_10560 [Geobacter sp. AOG2]|nr:hypothetical protein AOG2_10560 [Geobacter sp. AOG2]
MIFLVRNKDLEKERFPSKIEYGHNVEKKTIAHKAPRSFPSELRGFFLRLNLSLKNLS